MVQVNSQSDVDLMQRVTDYDTDSFGLLYDRYSTIIFSLIKEIVGDKDKAEKVLEDVFVILWNRIEDFDFRVGNVYTWLVTLAKNKAVDFMKRQSEDCKLPEYNDDYERNNIIPQLSPEISTVDLHQVFHTRIKLQEAISVLTDSQKYVLMLVIAGGSSEAEIAKKLSIPATTVRIKLQAAFNSIHEKFTEGI